MTCLAPASFTRTREPGRVLLTRNSPATPLPSRPSDPSSNESRVRWTIVYKAQPDAQKQPARPLCSSVHSVRGTPPCPDARILFCLFLNHQYDQPPVGRSLWRKFVRDGSTRGIKAKTTYPEQPATWPRHQPWLPDQVLALIQCGLLNAKSIGWLPTKAHFATNKAAKENTWPQDTLVVEEWLLIEYAVGSIPVNPETVVDAVAKSVVTKELCGILEWDHALFEDKPPPAPPQQEAPIRFTPLSEIERALAARIGCVSVEKLVNDIIDRKRGKV
jgi:hypothetical protein